MKDNYDHMDQLLKQAAAKRLERAPQPFHKEFIRLLENLPERKKGEVSALTQKQTGKRMRSRILATVASVIAVLGLAVGTYVSPTFAELMKSFFTRPELDAGLQNAAQHGFSQEQQTAVTNQGITLRVNEVLADTKRLIFTYSLQRSDGSAIDPTSLFQTETYKEYTDYYIKDRNNFYITDESGNVVSKSMTYGLLSGKEVTQSVRNVFKHDQFADVSFHLKENLTAKRLYLNIHLKKVDGVDGTWSLKVPVDLDKSIAATTTIPLNARYTTPSGLEIELKEVTYSPTVTTFTIRSEWTEQALREMKEKHPEYYHGTAKQRLIYHGLHYEIRDETGAVVASTLPRDRQTALLIDQEEIDPNDPASDRLSIVHQSFAPLDKNRKLTFVLKGIHRGEAPDKEWQITLKDLEKKRPTFAYKDYKATVTGIKYGKTSSVIELEEKGLFMGAFYDITDEKGNLLTVDEEDLKVEWGERDPKTMLISAKMQIPVEGLTQKNKSITLKLNSLGAFDQNMNWQVEIPTPIKK